jgi:hypothetical protein
MYDCFVAVGESALATSCLVLLYLPPGMPFLASKLVSRVLVSVERRHCFHFV